MDELLRARLRDLITIHNAMFRRLLFEQPLTAAELADLFRDVGKTYLELSEALHVENDYSEGDRR